MESLSAYLLFLSQVTIALLAIMNPFYTFPSFLAVTSQYPSQELESLARRTSLYAFGLLSFFLITGELLFIFFGFTLGAFKVGGGILLFLIGLNMIFEKHSTKQDRIEATEADIEDRDDIALVPLAIPMLAGPGTMIYESAILIAIAIGSLLSYIVYRHSKKINQLLGKMGVLAIVKIMGLIIIAVSVQTITSGIKELFTVGVTI